MSLGLFETGESVEAQYNPREVKMVVEANYNRTRVPGQVGEEMQFSHVSNIKPSFELVFDSRAPGAPDIARVEAFMLALLHPPRKFGGITSGSPPLVIFSWPNWVMLVTRMPKFEQTTTWFEADGRPARQSYRVELETQYTRRIGREDILRSAFRRVAA
jgi:hypothetical protein